MDCLVALSYLNRESIYEQDGFSGEVVSVGIMDGRLKRPDYLISLTQIQMHRKPLGIYVRKHNIFHRTLDTHVLPSLSFSGTLYTIYTCSFIPVS